MMMRSTDFDSLLQLENFSFGDDDKDFIDDFSISASTDSYENYTSKESSDSELSVSFGFKQKKAKKIRLNNSADDEEQISQWQRKQYEITHLPKLVRTDVRRSYANIFSNIINTLDFPSMFEFLNHYCVPHLVHSQTTCNGELDRGNNHYNITTGANGKPFANLFGLPSISQFWYNKMHMVPDLVYQLSDTQVHTYSHTESSKIVSRLVFSGTRLFDIPFESVFPKQKEVDMLDATGAAAAPTTSRKRGRGVEQRKVIEISDDIWQLMTPENKLPEPIEMTMSFVFTMHLNASKHIEKMEIEII